MADLALGAGIGEGLQSMVQTYLQTKNMMQEQAIKKRLANAQSVDAYAKLIQSGGTKRADAQMANLGLLQPNQDSAHVAQGYLPAGPNYSAPSPSVSGQNAQPIGGSTGPGLGNGPAVQPGGGYLPPSVDQIKQIDEQAHELPEGPGRQAIYAAGLPKGQLELQKGNTDLKNAQNEPYFRLKTEYDSDKTTQNTREAAVNLQKILAYDPKNKSPTAAKGLVYNYLKIENPGVGIGEGSLADMRKNQNISQSSLDKAQEWLSGTPTDTTINDIKRASILSYQGGREAHSGVQERYQQQAQSLGVPGSFINDPTLTQLDSKASKVLKQIGPQYQSTVQQAVNESPAAQDVIGAVKNAGQSALNTAKGLIQTPDTANANRKVPTFEEFKAMKRAGKLR